MPWPIHWTIYLAGAPCRVCLFSQYQGPTIIRSATRYSLGLVVVVIVQSLGRVRHSSTPWTAARQASLSFNISWSLLKLTSIESVMPSNHLVLCRSLLLLPSICWDCQLKNIVQPESWELYSILQTYEDFTVSDYSEGLLRRDKRGAGIQEFCKSKKQKKRVRTSKSFC